MGATHVLLILFVAGNADKIFHFSRSLMEHVCFRMPIDVFFRKPRGKRSFLKIGFSLMTIASWKTFVLEVIRGKAKEKGKETERRRKREGEERSGGETRQRLCNFLRVSCAKGACTGAWVLEAERANLRSNFSLCQLAFTLLQLTQVNSPLLLTHNLHKLTRAGQLALLLAQVNLHTSFCLDTCILHLLTFHK